MDKKDITAIRINSNSNIITYYNKNNDNTFNLAPALTTSYLGFTPDQNAGNPMVLGAIISESNLYECNVQKTLLKLKILYGIYSNRTEILKKYFSAYALGSREHQCAQAYSTVDLSSDLPGITSVIENGFTNSPPNPTSNLFNSITSNAYSLKTTNENFMLNSCPLIY